MALSPGIAPLLLSLGFGFACGSIPFGYIAGRLRGVDVLKSGSRSTGFTNVQRTLGIAWGLPVLLLDVAKGALPTALAPGLGLAAPLVGLGCILGHVFSPWLGLRGGKGVATALGVFGAALGWWSVPLYVVYIGVLLAAGYVSVASLAFALMLTPLSALVSAGDAQLVALGLGSSTVIIARHTDNIRRLAAGAEPRFGLWLKLFRKQ